MPHTAYWPLVTSVAATGEPSLLQKQLGLMEGEVKEIQMELAAIKRNRMESEIPKQKCYGEGPNEVLPENVSINSDTKYPNKEIVAISQNAKLREQLDNAKCTAEQERYQREKYETKLRELETKINSIRCTETVAETESVKVTNEEILIWKNQVRDLNEEIEELKISEAEKCEQLQEYRAKYLQAQQQVEELRRQIEVLDFDNRQVSDQIQVEIQKMKIQFQTKLQELVPLPELLAGARAQLHEARQLQALAEENGRHLANEVHLVNEKLVVAINSLNQEKAERSKLVEENQCLKLTIGEHRKEIEELSRSVDDFKSQMLRLGEKLRQQEARYNEKLTECNRLVREMEEQRTEGQRALNRAKERGDCMRRYMQTQISELERQLIQTRAQCTASQKERDEIRRRVQIQISNLQENFELVEIRLRALQNQVTSLKNSYTLVLADDEENTDSNKIVNVKP